MKHTPPPWTVDSTHVHTSINSGDRHIAMVNYHPGLIDGDEHIANARLIAKAPEMYALLEECIDVLIPILEVDVLNKINALLSEVRGQ